MQPRYYGVGWRCLGSPLCWLVIFSVVLICLLMDMVFDRFRAIFKPLLLDVVRIQDQKNYYRLCGCVDLSRQEGRPRLPTNSLIPFLDAKAKKKNEMHEESGDQTAGSEETPPTEKNKRPKAYPFYQQEIYGWQPLATPTGGVVLLTCLSLVLIFFGVLIEFEKDSLDSMKVTYSGQDVPDSLTTMILKERSASSDVAWHTCATNRSGAAWRECTITFNIGKKLRGPLQVYYGVENMYQNNLVYSTSASYPQLRGEFQDKEKLRLPCSKGYWSRDDDLYWPCGLIANSMFTDRFEVVTPGVTMSERGISWPTDSSHVFRNPASWKPNSTIPKYIFVDEIYAKTPYASEFAQEGLDNEHLQVWMRPAAFSSFRKRYGIIDQDIGPINGSDFVLQFRVTDAFDVQPFEGKKSLTISEQGSLSSRDSILGVANIAMGLVFLLFAISFFIQQALCCPGWLELEK